MASVFVTGPNGFIGSHLVGLLLARGHEVTGLVRPTSDLRRLEPLFRGNSPRLRLVVGDLRDRATLGPGLAGAEYVYHLGAVLMATSEGEFREAIVHGTRNLLEAVARHCGSTLRRFLHTSSQAAAGPSPDSVPIDETAGPHPVSWYGRAKQDAEVLVRNFGTRGLPITIVRPVAVYGEGEETISGGLFPAVRLGLLPRVGFAEGHACFVHVEDLVRGMVAAAESPASVGKTYFLSDPAPYTSRQIVGAVADAMGNRLRVPVVTPPSVLAVGALLAEWLRLFTRGRPLLTRDKVREVRQRFWTCSPAAAKRDLGWEARVLLKTGMARAVADWEERREVEARVDRQPIADRAIQTYSPALGFGVLVEGTARLADWYRFEPGWIVLVVVLVVFGGVMGSLTLWTARWRGLAQFVAGAAIGIGAEVANAFWLHLWTFNPESLGRIPGPWIRSVVIGLPAGLLPVLVNAIVRGLYRKRLRLG